MYPSNRLLDGERMLVGIMSDSHDNVRGLKDALGIFSDRGAKLVLHAGDMIGSGNCYAFHGCGMEVKLVFGNNDGDRAGLIRDFAPAGGQYLGDFGEVEADGLKIAMLHGTEEALARAVAASQLYDVVVRGHSHRFETMIQGRTLLINPGEIWGHLTGYRSAAILDTSSLEVERIDLGSCSTIQEILKS
jgi:putative phosphoesterase